MSMTPAEWLDAYRKAWVERDPDAAAALFSVDASYAEQPYDDAFVGRGAIREYWARVTKNQTAIEIRYGTPIAAGERTVVEWWTTLSNEGVPITLAGIFILAFDESGLCRSLREYWHFAEGRKQPLSGWGD